MVHWQVMKLEIKEIDGVPVTGSHGRSRTEVMAHIIFWYGMLPASCQIQGNVEAGYLPRRGNRIGAVCLSVCLSVCLYVCVRLCPACEKDYRAKGLCMSGTREVS